MRLGDKGCEAADRRSEDSEYKSRVIESRNLPHGKEASVVPKTGAVVNRATPAGHLKNPPARGRGSMSGAYVRKVIRERSDRRSERTHCLWGTRPPKEKAGYK